MRLGFGEILIILIVTLLIFGPSKLPQLGDALGKGIRSFRKATDGVDEVPVPVVAPAPGLAAATQESPKSAQRAAPTEHAQS